MTQINPIDDQLLLNTSKLIPFIKLKRTDNNITHRKRKKKKGKKKI